MHTVFLNPRKIVTSLLAASVAVGYSCSSAEASDTETTLSTPTQGSSQAEPVTIDLLFPGLPFYLDALPATYTDEFTSETGVSVELIQTGEDYVEVDQRIASDIAAGDTADIALVGLGSLRSYAEAGVAQPLDDYLVDTQRFDVADIPEAVLDLGAFDGTRYAIPYVASSLIMYYNADLFEQAGLDPADPPDTYSELRAASEALFEAEVTDSPVAFEADGDNWRFQNLVASAGGTLMNDDESELTLTSPEVTDTLDFWQKMAADGLFTETGDSAEIFLRGDAAIIFHSSARTTTLGGQAAFEVRTAVLPIPDDGTRALPPAGAALMMLTDDPERQAAAWTAMSQLLSPEGVTTIVSQTGYVPLNRAAIEDPTLLGELLEREPLRQPAIEQSESYIPWYQFPGSHNVEINSILQEQVQRVLRDQGSATDAMTAAEDAIAPLLP